MLRTFIVSFAVIIIHAGDEMKPTPIMRALVSFYTKWVDIIESQRRHDHANTESLHFDGQESLKSVNDCPHGISAMDCLLRKLGKFTNCDDEIFVISHMYLIQFMLRNPEVQFDREMSLILVFASVISSIDESVYQLPDEQYGSVFGIPGEQVTALLKRFKQMMGKVESMQAKFEKAEAGLKKEYESLR